MISTNQERVNGHIIYDIDCFKKKMCLCSFGITRNLITVQLKTPHSLTGHYFVISFLLLGGQTLKTKDVWTFNINS
jgi:hypothetical protein